VAWRRQSAKAANGEKNENEMANGGGVESGVAAIRKQSSMLKDISERHQ
jgi:hypothetical protein